MDDTTGWPACLLLALLPAHAVGPALIREACKSWAWTSEYLVTSLQPGHPPESLMPDLAGLGTSLSLVAQ